MESTMAEISLVYSPDNSLQIGSVSFFQFCGQIFCYNPLKVPLSPPTHTTIWHIFPISTSKFMAQESAYLKPSKSKSHPVWIQKSEYSLESALSLHLRAILSQQNTSTSSSCFSSCSDVQTHKISLLTHKISLLSTPLITHELKAGSGQHSTHAAKNFLAFFFFFFFL